MRLAITGVTSYWGQHLVDEIGSSDDITIVGIDTREPPPEIARKIEFVEVDVRNPAIMKVLPELEPEVVCHCGIVWYPEPGTPARSLHDINVIGTLQLLSACERVPGLSAIVVRGSAAIYGSSPGSPRFFTEDMARRYPLETRFQRDIGELESYFEGFAKRRPSVICCMLRFQPEIGPDLDTPLVRYLRLPVVPTQLGFDPMLQLLHADDVAGSLATAIRNPVRGAVNVAPDGAISLSRILRLSGRPTLPVPHPIAQRLMAGPGRHMLGAADLFDDGIKLLRYGRGCDNERLREEVGYTPRFDAEGAVLDFLANRSNKVANSSKKVANG